MSRKFQKPLSEYGILFHAHMTKAQALEELNKLEDRYGSKDKD